MQNTISKIIYWLPRVLAIGLTAAWLVYVALSHGLSMPSLAEITVVIVMLAATAIAWKWPGVGAIIFLVLALLYIAIAWQRFTWTTILIAIAPLIIVGGLFLLSKYRK